MKKGQTKYGIVILLLGFWGFLILFGTIFNVPLVTGDFHSESGDVTVTDTITFIFKLATFQYPQINWISALLCDILIFITIFVIAMIIRGD